MLDGYAFVDQLISDRVDIFEMGHSSYWLKLNATVLCGADPKDWRGIIGCWKLRRLAFTKSRAPGLATS